MSCVLSYYVTDDIYRIIPYPDRIELIQETKNTIQKSIMKKTKQQKDTTEKNKKTQ